MDNIKKEHIISGVIGGIAAVMFMFGARRCMRKCFMKGYCGRRCGPGIECCSSNKLA